VETTANDLEREAHHDRATIRGAARGAPRQARVNQEVRESTVAPTKKAVSHGAEQPQRQTREALEAADRYVRAQPWEAISIAAIAGLAIGLLLGRR